MFYQFDEDQINLSGKSILITGGTGSFGNAILDRFLDSDIKEIRVFSRDEKKQHDMRVALYFITKNIPRSLILPGAAPGALLLPGALLTKNIETNAPGRSIRHASDSKAGRKYYGHWDSRT